MWWWYSQTVKWLLLERLCQALKYRATSTNTNLTLCFLKISKTTTCQNEADLRWTRLETCCQCNCIPLWKKWPLCAPDHRWKVNALGKGHLYFHYSSINQKYCIFTTMYASFKTIYFQGCLSKTTYCTNASLGILKVRMHVSAVRINGKINKWLNLYCYNFF